MAIPQDERNALLDLARRTVAAVAARHPHPAPPEPNGVLGETRGCFVTLKNRGRLRGCIGVFVPHEPLGHTVIEMAAAAACDPRFVRDPITPSEAPHLSVEISVLSPLVETHEPEKLEVGTHGIYIVGRSSGCFLPEVATEMNWTAEEFLDNCCSHKAGMGSRAWQQPGTKVYLFTSEKFGEEGNAD